MLIKLKPPYSREEDFTSKDKQWQQDTQIASSLNIIKTDNLFFTAVNQVFLEKVLLKVENAHFLYDSFSAQMKLWRLYMKQT